MIPSLLVKAFALNQGVIFAGTGLAQIAGLPGWVELKARLAAELDGCPPDAPYADVAQYYEIAYGRPRLIEKLFDEFSNTTVVPDTVHATLLTLPVRAVFTTGYDELWPRAIAQAGIPFQETTTDKPAHLWNNERPQLVRLFGDLAQPDSLLLTADDFDRFDRRRSWFIRHLPGILQASAILCLGYGATDPDLRLLLRAIRESSGESPFNLYLLQTEPPRLVARDLERRGVHLLTLPGGPALPAGDDGQVLQSWLQAFAAGVKARRDQTPAATAVRPPDQDRRIISNLPPLTTALLGREREVAEGVAKLQQPSALPLILEGAAGMGKSTLAKKLAHTCQEKNLFDSYVWWSAHYEPRSLSALLDAIGKLLGHQTIDSASTYDDPAAMHKLLAGYNCLLVVTKVTALQHREILDFLRNLPATCRAIITTSSRNLAFGDSIYLGPFDATASLHFIREKARQKGVRGLETLSDEKLRPLCEASGGLPVALTLSVGLVKSGVPLDEIVYSLKAGAGNFSILAANAYSRLEQPSRELLNLICISHDSVAAEALQTVLQLPPAGLEERLRQLSDLALIEVQYADTRARLRYGPSSRLIREYYNAAIRIVQPEEDRRLRDAMAGYYSEQCAQRGQERWEEHEWLNENLKEILATFRLYDQTQQWEKLVVLMKDIYYFLGVRGYWHERLTLGDRAGQAARQIGDRQSEAEILVRIIGWTEMQLKEYTKAQEDIQRGLHIFAELADHGGLASATCYLANLARDQGQHRQAATLYEKALAHAEQSSEAARYRASINISWAVLHLKMGRPETAEQLLLDALAIFEQIQHKSKIAEVYCRLANLKRQQGEMGTAEQYYHRSNKTAEPIGRQKTLAYNFLGLAQISYERRDFQVALDFAEKGHAIFANLGLTDDLADIRRLRRSISRTLAGESILEPEQRAQLHRLLSRHFNPEELRQLCFELDIDYDDLEGNTKSARGLALIDYLDRRGRLPELQMELKEKRPRVAWPDF
jgi:tetratricopeptide (TPR) repeat protein